jgi:hypothetical protein
MKLKQKGHFIVTYPVAPGFCDADANGANIRSSFLQVSYGWLPIHLAVSHANAPHTLTDSFFPPDNILAGFNESAGTFLGGALWLTIDRSYSYFSVFDRAEIEEYFD